MYRLLTVQAIVQRLESEIKPQADRIMNILIQVLTTVPPKSSVPDVVFATVGAIAGALEDEFIKYMDAFSQFLLSALGNQEEIGLCSMAIGLVSDIARALNEKVQPYCDAFMNHLLENLRVGLSYYFLQSGNPLLTVLQSSANQLKPAILETFGDIAQAIGTQFDTYLPVVGQVLQQASTVTVSTDITIEMLDYIVSLREGIMDAWGGILLSYKGTPQGMQCSTVLPCLSLILMTRSGSNLPLRRVHLPASPHHLTRPWHPE